MISSSAVKCSRAGCEQSAQTKIIWRNPKIHSIDRKKVWLACEIHQQYLIDYLDTRGFYQGTEEIQ
jgi:spore coat protein CotF